MSKKVARCMLVILWRTDGEESIHFSTKKEAEDYMHKLVASEVGHKVVKCEIVQQA